MAKYIIKGGPHYKRGEDGKWKRFVKGETIDLSDLEAQHIMDKLEPVGPKKSIVQDKPEKEETDDKPEKKEKQEEPEKLMLKMVHKGAGKYDVVNQKSGKKINSIPLSKDEASALLDDT